jgi:hypothetical protein
MLLSCTVIIINKKNLFTLHGANAQHIVKYHVGVLADRLKYKSERKLFCVKLKQHK